MSFVKARSGGFGMDAELASKLSLKFDTGRAAAAIKWIADLNGVDAFPVGEMGAKLKDGRMLCAAANRLQANACPKVNASSMPFKQMENVTAFINACRLIFKRQVPEHELFETVDLFEEKDLTVVVNCIFALGRAVTAAPPPGFAGPHLSISSPPAQVSDQPITHFNPPSRPAAVSPSSSTSVATQSSSSTPAPSSLQATHAGGESKSTAPAPVQQGDELFIHYEDSGVLSRAAALCHPADLHSCKAPPFCEGGIEKEKAECLQVFSRVHPKCSVALERMWDGFVASPDDIHHVIKGVSNERALLFMRAVFAKALKSTSASAVASAPVVSSATAVSHVHAAAPAKSGIVASSPSAAPAPAHVDGKRASVLRGGGFGLDAAVAQKIASKYDSDSESKMIAWISAVTKLSPGADQTFGEWLKNGQVLCALANGLKPNSIVDVSKGSNAFVQMQNIDKFLKACRNLFKVPEFELFETVDLFEEKDMTVVLNCLFSLGRNAKQQVMPGI